MLSVQNLNYQYPSGPELAFPDWEVAKLGQALLLGASGGGKTTFLHLLGGLLKPTSGRIAIGGTEIQNMPGAKLDQFRGAHMGFVFQKPHLLVSLTVKDNLKLATYLSKRELHNQGIDQLLEQLGIGELANRQVHEISQGQAQRVAIARAVIHQPQLLLCDEPTASLDDESCHAVIGLLKDQAKQCGATLIIATHDYRVKNEFETQLRL